MVKFFMLILLIVFLPCKLCLSDSTLSSSEVTTVINKVESIKPIKVKVIESDIVLALIDVESAGNDSAYNSSEDAVGCLQIRPIMIREVNRVLKKLDEDRRFEMKDRWDRSKSIEIFTIWRTYHHPDSDNQTISRNWNGGPDGYKKESTVKYWKKVKGRLDVSK